MINFIHADLYKLKKSLYMKIIGSISFIGAIAMAFFSMAIANGNVSKEVIELAYLFADFQMIGLLGAIFAASYICGDFENKSIQDMITSGAHRFQIVVAKSIVVAITITYLLLPYVLVAVIGVISSIKYQAYLPSVFLMIMKNSNQLPLSIGVFLRILLLFLTVALVYVGQLSICTFLSFSIKKPAIVMIGSYVISFIGGQSQSLKEDSIIKKILSITPFGCDFSKLVLDANAKVFVRNWLVSIGFVSIIMLLTYVVFRKSEVK